MADEGDEITTVEGLAALPEKTTVVDRMNDIGVVQAGHVHFPETAPMQFGYAVKHYAPFRVLVVGPGSAAVQRLRTVVREARACVQAEGGHLDQTVRIGLRDLDALALFVEQAVQVAEQHDPPRGDRPRQECVCHLCVLVREAGWLNQDARLRERYQEVFGG